MCTHSMRHGHDLCPYLRPWRLKAGNHQENRSSVFHWVVRKGGGSEADFYLLSFPISVCNLPSSIFSNRHSLTHTYTHTQTPTHSDLCAVNICPAWLPRKVKKRETESRGNLCSPCRPSCFYYLNDTFHQNFGPDPSLEVCIIRLPTTKLRLVISGRDLSSVALARLF